jgi:hypothetical protein
VTTLLRTGAIDGSTAAKWFADAGLDADTQAAYLRSVNGEKLAGTRQLSQGVVLELYQAQAVDNPTAAGWLGKLGYTAAQAGFLLELTDLRRETTAHNKAVTRIGTLYTNHRITRPSAVALLDRLGIVGAHQANLMATWDLETSSEVKLPTITEIGNALKYGAITEAEAISEALKLGYQPFDAYVALSSHYGGPLTVKPAPGPIGPGVI